MKRYRLLDASRGLAIMWIVSFHLLAGVQNSYGAFLNSLIAHGYLGVSMFFVISGFGIARSADMSKQSCAAGHIFFWQRLKRIYPAYWWHLVFIALIFPVLGALVSMLKTHTFAPGYTQYSFAEWIQTVTLLKIFTATSWQLNHSFLPLNGVVWYIAVLVQMYLAVSLCLYDRKHLSWSLAAICILSLLTYIPSINMIVPYGLFLPRFAEFYVGILLYVLLKNSLVPKSLGRSIIILALFAAAVAFCAAKDNRFLSLSVACAFGYLFLALHQYDERACGMKAINALCLVGTFSYSLYLLHVPMSPYVDMFVRNLVPLREAITTPLFLIPAIVTLSYIWHLFFEKPSSQKDVLAGIKKPLGVLAGGWQEAIAALRSMH